MSTRPTHAELDHRKAVYREHPFPALTRPSRETLLNCLAGVSSRPIAVGHDCQLTGCPVHCQSKAVRGIRQRALSCHLTKDRAAIQFSTGHSDAMNEFLIWRLLSSVWPSLEQRYLTATSTRFREVQRSRHANDHATLKCTCPFRLEPKRRVKAIASICRVALSTHSKHRGCESAGFTQ
jgi:hypothetical protein